MVYDNHGEDIAQVVQAVSDELDARLSEHLALPDWAAVIAAVSKAAMRGFTLGAAASEREIRSMLEETEARLRDAGVNLPNGLLLPIEILDSDGTPFAEPDVWAKRYGSE